MAITMTVLRLLKKLSTINKMTLSMKRLIWVVCCSALHGSFRIHELLAREELNFDPTSTLQGKDLRKFKVNIEGKMEDLIAVYLKNPKEDQLRIGVNIELFSTTTLTCPIGAWTK